MIKKCIYYNVVVHGKRDDDMRYTTSKQQIKDYLKLLCHDYRTDLLSSMTTQSIAKALNLSRSITSQYLNELVKDNKIIKISSRPVYYLHKHELEKRFQTDIMEQEYISILELHQVLYKNAPQLQDFEKAIGNDGSLSYTISQIKSALEYPKGGLPIILFGEKGVGKGYLVTLMQEYGSNHLHKDTNCKLIKKRMLKGTNAQQQMDEIFGYVRDETNVHKGVLDHALDGILCIEDAQNLSEACQIRLSEYISSTTFTREQDENTRIEGHARIVLTMVENPYNVLSHSLLEKIPVICKLPSLVERSEDERMQFIIQFFQKEQYRLDKSIYIGNHVLNYLMNYRFENNINELSKCVQSICVNAFKRNRTDRMDVHVYDLPLHMLNHIRVEESTSEEEELLCIDRIEKRKSNKIVTMWEQLLYACKKYLITEQSLTSFIEEGQRILRYYYDVLVFQENYYDTRLDTMEHIVMETLALIRHKREIRLPLHCSYVLTRMLIALQKNTSFLAQWDKEHSQAIEQCMAKLHAQMHSEYIVSEVITKKLQANLNIRLNDMNKIFLMLNINFYNKDIRSQDTVGIILSHGYSTASSIADAANTLLNTFIFEAIDMPLDTSIEEVGEQLNKFIADNLFVKNIILLVDMGSLEDIGNKLVGSVNVGVINNISTSLALNIGYKIKQHYELEDVLRIACEENQCHYKVLAKAEKEKVIVFVNDAGIVVAEKLCRLFKDSLPRSIEMNMMEYDYDAIKKNGSSDMLFQKYDVKLMIKPDSLQIKNIHSVTLEDIMNFKNIEKVNHALLPYLSEQEIEQFDQQLLKNFSLQSVMESITILNAVLLLDYVSDAVYSLQRSMHTRFQSKIIVGLYIHICFLIERLVTKTALEKYVNVDTFIREEQAFIAHVNASFEAMLEHYHVCMPISEIAYLHEYIANDIQQGGEEDGEDEF